MGKAELSKRRESKIQLRKGEATTASLAHRKPREGDQAFQRFETLFRCFCISGDENSGPVYRVSSVACDTKRTWSTAFDLLESTG